MTETAQTVRDKAAWWAAIAVFVWLLFPTPRLFDATTRIVGVAMSGWLLWQQLLFVRSVIVAIVNELDPRR